MDEPGSLGTMKMRGADLSFNITPVIITTWGERLSPFTGPVAILTDSGTASTSEVFAGGLQSLGRIEAFGTRSAGMALPAGMEKLPSGDVLLHAIADFVTSTGYQLEHGGVVPEHIIPLTRSDLLKGIDSPKEAAAEWIQRSVME
jgi:carboxyl-terminal processing protease